VECLVPRYRFKLLRLHVALGDSVEKRILTAGKKNRPTVYLARVEASTAQFWPTCRRNSTDREAQHTLQDFRPGDQTNLR